MKVEDFNKTNEELKAEIQKNNEQINISDERKRMADVNQFEYKVMETIAFSLLPYLGLVILSEVLTKSGIMASLTGTIPAESFPFIIAGSSLCVGTIGRKILEWKFKTKERVKSFTTANTQSEKIQEEVKHTVELEKAKNRNKVIQQTMDSLSSNQSILNSLFGRCDINDRTISQTEEEAKKRVEDLSILLKDKFEELDVLTTQKILHEKFWRVRTKSQKVIDIIMSGMMGGFITMMYWEISILIIRDYISSLGLMMSLITPLIIGTAGVSGYMIKRNKDYTTAFNNLNNELGENSLPDKISEAYEEQQDIDSKIENKIREISIVESQLQEHKRIMESFLNGSDEKAQTINSTISKDHTIEESEKDTILGYNQEDLMSSMDEDIFKGVKKEPQEETKGPSLVLRRKSNNTQNPQK